MKYKFSLKSTHLIVWNIFRAPRGNPMLSVMKLHTLKLFAEYRRTHKYSLILIKTCMIVGLPIWSLLYRDISILTSELFPSSLFWITVTCMAVSNQLTGHKAGKSTVFLVVSRLRLFFLVFGWIYLSFWWKPDCYLPNVSFSVFAVTKFYLSYCNIIEWMYIVYCGVHRIF